MEEKGVQRVKPYYIKHRRQEEEEEEEEMVRVSFLYLSRRERELVETG